MSQQQGPDPLLIVALCAILVAFFGAIIWLGFGLYITEAFRWLRIGQLWLFELVTNNFFGLRQLRLVATQQHFVPWSGVLALSAATMKYWKWPLAAAAFFWAYQINKKAVDNKYKKKHSLETLMAAQVKTWPVISPILRFNPSLTSARVPGKPVPTTLPLFAEALSPEEWVAMQRIPLLNNTPDRDAARRAFIAHMGARWYGVESLPPHCKALFAAFALKGVQKRKDSDDLLGKVALCWSPEKGLVLNGQVMKIINDTLTNPSISDPALEVANRFAYTVTALLGLLKHGREQGGVIAPATFLWLRGVDRNLWYPLNNLGRQSFHIEASAAMSHFLNELNARKPLVLPRVDAAVDALVTYFNETRPTVPPLEGEKKSRLPAVQNG